MPLSQHQIPVGDGPREPHFRGLFLVVVDQDAHEALGLGGGGLARHAFDRTILGHTRKEAAVRIADACVVLGTMFGAVGGVGCGSAFGVGAADAGDHQQDAGGSSAEAEGGALEAAAAADVDAGASSGDGATPAPNLCCRSSSGGPLESVTCSVNAFACGGVDDGGPQRNCAKAPGCELGEACMFCPPGPCDQNAERYGLVVACE